MSTEAEGFGAEGRSQLGIALPHFLRRWGRKGLKEGGGAVGQDKSRPFPGLLSDCLHILFVADSVCREAALRAAILIKRLIARHLHPLGKPR